MAITHIDFLWNSLLFTFKIPENAIASEGPRRRVRRCDREMGGGVLLRAVVDKIDCHARGYHGVERQRQRREKDERWCTGDNGVAKVNARSYRKDLRGSRTR